MSDAFRLNPGLDADRLRAAYARAGRLHIPDFLVAEDAERLYRALREDGSWRLVVNQSDKVFELDREAQAAMSPEQKRELERAVHVAARHDFQYFYETIRVPDGKGGRLGAPSALNRFAQFLSEGPALALLAKVTGHRDIAFADAQATAYGLGHFLTGHDDAVPGKDRRAAYVFNLTPAWRPEWGGLLLFHGPDGHIEQGFTPSFNALNIFSVPQPHSVSIVAPFAASRRYSVTGWLRACAQPD